MHLGSRNLTSGDSRRYTVDYRGFLQPGEKLKTPAVTVPAGTVSSIGAVSYDFDDDKMFFFVIGGTLLGEVFTASVQVSTTFNQEINDTIAFTIVAP
jgi:hypothetical protein